jgi:uncharacterized protein with PIN domain
MGLSKKQQEAYVEKLLREAPPRCEMCDHPLPSVDEREKHMKETGHCECKDCGRYAPPGRIYAHFFDLHTELEMFNDHMYAAWDESSLRQAMPWVRQMYGMRE